MALKQLENALSLFAPYPLSRPATQQSDPLRAFGNLVSPAAFAAAYLDTSMKLMTWAFGMIPDYQAAMQLVLQRSVDRFQAIEPQEPLAALLSSALPPVHAENDNEW